MLCCCSLAGDLLPVCGVGESLPRHRVVHPFVDRHRRLRQSRSATVKEAEVDEPGTRRDEARCIESQEDRRHVDDAVDGDRRSASP